MHKVRCLHTRCTLCNAFTLCSYIEKWTYKNLMCVRANAQWHLHKHHGNNHNEGSSTENSNAINHLWKSYFRGKPIAKPADCHVNDWTQEQMPSDTSTQWPNVDFIRNHTTRSQWPVDYRSAASCNHRRHSPQYLKFARPIRKAFARYVMQTWGQ
jgi:hypothetical protein